MVGNTLRVRGRVCEKFLPCDTCCALNTPFSAHFQAKLPGLGSLDMWLLVDLFETPSNHLIIPIAGVKLV
jgi:hypothetical protein